MTGRIYHIIPVVNGGGNVVLDRDVIVVGLARNQADLAAPGAAVPLGNLRVGDALWGVNNDWDLEALPSPNSYGKCHLPMPPTYLPAGASLALTQPTGAAALAAGSQLELVCVRPTEKDRRPQRAPRIVIYSARSGEMDGGQISTQLVPILRPFKLYYTLTLARNAAAGADWTPVADSGVHARVKMWGHSTTNNDTYVHLRTYGTRQNPLAWSGYPVPATNIQVDFQNTNTAGTWRMASVLFIGRED